MPRVCNILLLCFFALSWLTLTLTQVAFPVRFETGGDSYFARKLFWSVSLSTVQVYCRHCEGRHCSRPLPSSPPPPAPAPDVIHALCSHHQWLLSDESSGKKERLCMSDVIVTSLMRDVFNCSRLRGMDSKKISGNLFSTDIKNNIPELINSDYVKGTTDWKLFLSHKDETHVCVTFFFTSLLVCKFHEFLESPKCRVTYFSL
jgi:hypothetical protein